MRKVLYTLIVLAILAGMFVCLGAQAFAEGNQTAVFAVSGAQLSVDSIGTMREQAPDSLIIDVDGLADGQGATGYSVVWRESDPMVMSDVAYVWPGFAQMFYVGPESKLVVVVGVGNDTSSDQIEAAVSDYLGEDPYVIAVGPNGAAAAIGGCTNVDMFMTSGLEGDAATAAAGAVGAAKLENVGSDKNNPVCRVVLGDTVTADAIPVPGGASVADPSAGDPVISVPEQSTETEPEIEPTQPPTCNIWYKGGDGSTGSMPDVIDFVVGQTLFFPNNDYYTYEGHEFIGWKVDGDENIYQPQQEYVVMQDITVTAQWKEVEYTYTVTYAPGEGAQGQPQSLTVTGGSIELYACPADFVYEGHDFAGWQASTDGETYQSASPFTVESDVTFTAQWTETPAVKNAVVTYLPGEHGTGEPITQTVENIGEGVSYGVQECTFAPDGNYAFTGWKVEGDDTLYKANTGNTEQGQYFLTGDVTFTAQWEATEASQPENTDSPAPSLYTVTYYDGSGNPYEGQALAAGTKFNLAKPEDCGFTVPEGKSFGGWKYDADEQLYGLDAEFTMPEANVTFTAEWVDAVVTYTVTYKPNGGTGTDVVLSDQAEGSVIKLLDSGFTAPANQSFDGWVIEGDTSGNKYQANTDYTVTGDVTFLATWKAMTGLNAGATTTDSLTFTLSGTDQPSLSFSNAAISAVSFDGTALVSGTDYTLSNEDKTVTLSSSYLNTRSTGTHQIKVEFKAGPNGESYEPVTRNIEIQAAPATEQPAQQSTYKISWTDRSASVSQTFNSAPVKVEIDYGVQKNADGSVIKNADGTDAHIYKEAVKDRDYTVNGNTLTLLPGLINGNWGVWPNATYSLRVTLAGDSNSVAAGGSNVVTLQITLTGTTPTTQPSATPSQTPGTDSNVPVTGDETPITLYIVVLIVLIIALAVVLIFVMKRRNSGSGSRGRH